MEKHNKTLRQIGHPALYVTLHSLQNAVRQLTLESFVEMHRNQLESSAVPRDTWPALFRKITEQVFDAGSAFSLMQLEDDAGAVAGWKAVVVKEGGVRCGDPDEIYLVDHAWTFRPSLAREPDFLALKHESRILGHSSNPVSGFSMMERVSLCAVWPM